MIIGVLVGAKKRESTHGIQKSPPLSGDCFWQLEKSVNPLCGNALYVAGNIRGCKVEIKH